MMDPVWATLAMAMYKQGKTDEQIAAVLDLNPWQIAHWRKKNNLSRRREGYGRPRTFDQQKAVDLHKQGKTDTEIAAAVNVCRQTITSWRNELGLKPNSLRPGTPRSCKLDWAAALPLYEKGQTDKQIAAVLGCSHKTVCKWRRKNGLPCKTLKGG
jgi:DNA-binding CsgD family transcriptional regulator